jgi:predicted transcriptional regulator of viral defense system
MAPELLESGVEETVVDGVPVRITSAARTVVDCFRFRNKIGIDIAVEALREGWRSRRFTVDELRRHQVLCRVARVMAPYVEAILE